ncbi:hypothetical protein AYO44_17050 [Planctomycetaceae bacterium SCGC AG-212-F19]|nr:hypothetical protein AYO44_17050 [Planctomycetaceae bacterium SCGC AG-212-F19]
MAKSTTITEANILEKVIAPNEAELSPEGARALLGFKFDRATTQTIRKLLRANNRGRITAEDRLVLEKYLRVGQLLDLLHAKARLSLNPN